MRCIMELPMEICFLIAVIISVGIYVLLSSSLGFLAGVLAIAAFPCLLVGVSQYFDGRSPREKKLRKKFTNFINSYYENSEKAICNLEQITKEFLYAQEYHGIGGGRTPLPEESVLFIRFEAYLRNTVLFCYEGHLYKDSQKAYAEEMRKVYVKYLKALILKGLITQAEADKHYSNFESQIK